ncbi:uncharacterized protein P174DRAFT_458281 [Aspergillus novofumigatus IBT 16806]|uniref:Uncharacterized protein n=1 Tax=Aspergillus novofumigatus (strain IBT 16806) TaxID=1392255 RepID=A0A2I1CJ80_ASPN1|nr:uncharacterized protein P174DRAFT_458281 [Aspergillus novofumigatus IBT 16806]PKX97654.1 hypothetical protein P174DRAFT_458281 [Aspergillus novofumigatus IBT 16806]
MVLGIVNIIMMSTMIPTMIPGLVGLTEDDKHNRRDDHDLKREDEKRRQADDRTQPSNLQVVTRFQDGSITERLQLEGAKVYADPNRKLYITKHPSPEMVLFKGGFYPHPAFGRGNTSGFVCIGAECPPTLRWVFCDVATSEMRYGSREDSEGQICGPWDASQDEQEYVTLQDNQWLAVQLPNSEEHQAWQLYYNAKDSSATLPAGARFMEVHLKRLPVA